MADAAKVSRLPAERFSSGIPASHLLAATQRMEKAASTIMAPSNPAEKNEMRS
jgi:hypothetical protein